MLHRFGGRAARADFNRLRMVHRPLDERFDLRRNGGGKQRGVALASDIFPRAGARRAKIPCPASGRLRRAREIPPCPAARCLVRDDPAGVPAWRPQRPRRREFIRLLAVTDAAINDGDFQIREARIIANGRFHLRREFARRLQNERARADRIVSAQLGKNRQGERGSLAGAGLRAADDVLAGQNQRNGAKLDGGRIHITHRLDAVQHDWRKT